MCETATIVEPTVKPEPLVKTAKISPEVHKAVRAKFGKKSFDAIFRDLLGLPPKLMGRPRKRKIQPNT